MFKQINLHLGYFPEISKKSEYIYESPRAESTLSLLNNNEACADFVVNYAPEILNQDKEIFYISFNGKKIKEQIANKKTLVAIRKLNDQKILADLHRINYFEIGGHKYNFSLVNNIILCDLLYAKGGIFDANEIHSAIFFPYFIENQTSGEKFTLIFTNIIFERFKVVSKEIFNRLNFKLSIEGKIINLNDIEKVDISRWVTLHECAHNSGPLSLFTSDANKFSTKKYGFIEEMRVDLTSIKVILDSIGRNQMSGAYKKVIAIIILERILRGALYNYHPKWDMSAAGMFSKQVEGDVSIAMLILLSNYKIIDLNKKIIDLTEEKLKLVIDTVLSDIYKYEHLASEKNAFDHTSLKFSSLFRKTHLPVSQSVLSFLDAYSVQDCEYKIFFD